MQYQLSSVNYVIRAESSTINGISNSYGIRVYRIDDSQENKLYEQSKPLCIWIKSKSGKMITLEQGYDRVEVKNDKIITYGEIQSPSGSEFSIQDTYSIFDEVGAFNVSRKVTLVEADDEDIGFTSRFSLKPVCESPMEDYDMFVPGVWYRRNENVANEAIAGDYSHSYFYIREMRMSLPLFMIKHRNLGETLTVSHIDANPTSGIDEASDHWSVDESIQYGSLGIYKNIQPRIDFVFPGWEGEVNYINRESPWIKRSHPLKPEVIHEYQLVFKFENSTEPYEKTMKRNWRYFYNLFNPKIKKIDVNRIYKNGIKLLEKLYDNYNGVEGLPFKVTVPEGDITGNAMVMGFVGQQLPAAYQMLRYGINQSHPELVKKGSAIINFWVNKSMTESGLPLTWYEPYFEETGVFTNSNIDLRTMSDGMEGVINAYRFMKSHQVLREEWLNYSLKFGNWLVDNQNEDGSYFRIYDLKGNPNHLDKFNTTNPIRFLVRLYEVTNKIDFLNAAIFAGEFAYKNIYLDFNYVGGTSDNDNTIDKEAGTIAMNAFLSLYDATQDKRWLEAFQGAADFAETWTYAWSYRVESEKSNTPFPKSGLIGQSLVATGHSYIDMYMAYKSAQYYRLGLFTEDQHYIHFSRILQHNTNQLADSDGKWNYKYPGLIEEGQEVAELSYKGVGVWLNWCTVAQLEPLSELEERFGMMSVDDLERLSKEQKKIIIDKNINRIQ